MPSPSNDELSKEILRDMLRPRFSLRPLLAALAWISEFALSWLVLLGKIEKDGTALAFLIFFFVIALFSSFSVTPTRKP